MSVAIFDPKQSELRMTPAATAHARRQIASKKAQGLRLGVKKSGCSGYMYVVDFVHTPEADDHAIALADGVTVYVQQQVMPLVLGTEIDYVTEGLNSTLKFQNPNASAKCGCGESFAVE